MYELTVQHRSRVAELCRQYHVRRLELFGSAAGEDFRVAGSDLDFLVEFLDANRGRGLDDYFALKDALEALFGRTVDLVMPEAVTNPYLRRDIERNRTTVYAA